MIPFCLGGRPLEPRPTGVNNFLPFPFLYLESCVTADLVFPAAVFLGFLGRPPVVCSRVVDVPGNPLFFLWPFRPVGSILAARSRQ